MAEVRPLPIDPVNALPEHQSLLVTGGTGFVGQRLIAVLTAAGHEVTVLTRDARKARQVLPDELVRLVTDLEHIDRDQAFDAIVNLAGEPISDGLWTQARRDRIVRSRLAVTRQVVRLIGRLDHKPVLVSGSAIGWYGLRGDEPLDETSGAKPCFSHEVCAVWEEEAMKAHALGARVILLRTGLVLDRDGGMLQRLLLPFRLGFGGRFGDGRHWMSWIHRDDLIGLILHTIAGSGMHGPVNGTAPNPVTNRQFTRVLGAALHRPAVLPVPAWPLKVLLGDFAQELLLSGQRVLPTGALENSFPFKFPTLEDALDDILSDRTSS